MPVNITERRIHTLRNGADHSVSVHIDLHGRDGALEPVHALQHSRNHDISSRRCARRLHRRHLRLIRSASGAEDAVAHALHGPHGILHIVQKATRKTLIEHVTDPCCFLRRRIDAKEVLDRIKHRLSKTLDLVFQPQEFIVYAVPQAFHQIAAHTQHLRRELAQCVQNGTHHFIDLCSESLTVVIDQFERACERIYEQEQKALPVGFDKADHGIEDIRYRDREKVRQPRPNRLEC